MAFSVVAGDTGYVHPEEIAEDRDCPLVIGVFLHDEFLLVDVVGEIVGE